MDKKTKIGVILPSRGLIFSQTADEILQNLKDIPHRIFFSHQLPIPDCFEKPLKKALKGSYTHIWLVEDDMILPSDILKQMLEIDKAVVTVNYPTTAKQDAAILTVKGQIIYGGTGCTLVKREVFEELKPPYFRDDIAWIPKSYGDYIKFTAIRYGSKKGYGLHDVNFFMNLYRIGIPVHKLDFSVGQRKLKALGKAGTNDGAHDIEEWHKVKKDRYFTLKKGLPVEKTGSLVEITTQSGNVMAKQDHADKLIKLGLATKPPKRAVVIDDSEII